VEGCGGHSQQGVLMNKQYMRKLIKNRISVLEYRYKCALKDRDELENKITKGAAAAIRTACKRDLQLLELLLILVMTMQQDSIIDNDDAIEGFHRLVTPNERFRKQRG